MRHSAWAISFGGAAIVLMLLSACASPVKSLWPVPPESAAHTMYVSIDTWHAMIAFPTQPEGSDQLSAFSIEGNTPQHLFEEWGYAERAWYLEGKTGLSGIIRALFWPTEGVVEVGYYDRVWAERTPQPPSAIFSFRLSEEGYQRLRRHLHATLLSEDPVASFGQSVFYPAKRSYHLFHTCHQYAALTLREAGLPVLPFWAFNRTSLAWQLRRAARLVEEQPGDAPAVESR
ncbi:MAG TPA: DUF2459 domain-containing protein [Nitrospira sp.]|nr:DUF2459 domain-containing protein [Nitrospira sp.]